ncbi:MAG: 3-hydroxyacyl-CoA dehydrogenase NAD-binding domain-containing protein [bacterium]
MNISTISCVGAGLIGQGWATLFSAYGYAVTLHDLNAAMLETAMLEIQSNLAFLEKHQLVAAGTAGAAIKRITPCPVLEAAVDQADYIQESVPDNPELKRQVFQAIDAVCPRETIIASSASGLLMSEIQTATRYPARCVLAHPILPVHLIPLVEIVGGDLTANETITACVELMQSIGKTPVRLKKEVPGYIVNRLQAALMREAFDLVASGVADAEAVDQAFCSGVGLRDPFIGPLLRAHLAGNGIQNFIRNYDKSYQKRWQSMVSWTAVPETTADSVIKGVNEMTKVRSQSIEEMKAWRDDQLIKLLKIIDPG